MNASLLTLMNIILLIVASPIVVAWWKNLFARWADERRQRVKTDRATYSGANHAADCSESPRVHLLEPFPRR